MANGDSPTAMSGLVIISLPKSGTIFLSRYLQSISGYNYRFGLLDYMLDPDQLAKVLIPSDPLITEVLDEAVDFASEFVEVYRRSIYPSRKEKSLDFGNWIISDHGFNDLAVFWRNPSLARLISPYDVEEYAKRRGMKVLYLYREDIRDVANSFAHFISSRRTRFLNIRTFREALEVCIEKHVPVLARQIRTWRHEFKGMQISYESLHSKTRETILSICEEFDITCDRSHIIDNMNQFKAASFRKGGSGDYRNHLNPEQIEFLTGEYPDLCPDG